MPKVTDTSRLNPPTPLGRFILNEIQEKELTPKEYSRLLNVDPATVMRILGTAAQPDLHVLVQIAKYLDVDLLIVIALSRPSYADIVTNRKAPNPEVEKKILELPGLPQDAIEAIRKLIEKAKIENSFSERQELDSYVHENRIGENR